MAGPEETALARERGGGLRVGMQIYGGVRGKGGRPRQEPGRWYQCEIRRNDLGKDLCDGIFSQRNALCYALLEGSALCGPSQYTWLD